MNGAILGLVCRNRALAFEKRNKMKKVFFQILFFSTRKSRDKEMDRNVRKKKKIVEGSMGFLIGVKGIIFTAKKCK